MAAAIALVMSGIALLVSGASLVWQVVSWKRSGHVVACMLDMGTHTEGAKTTEQVFVSARVWSARSEFRKKPGQCFVVTARNSGRASVDVSEVGLTAGSTTVVVAEDSGSIVGPSWPCRLEAGQTHRWFIPVHIVEFLWEEVDRKSDTTSVHGAIGLGSGERIVTSEGVQVGLLRQAAAVDRPPKKARRPDSE